MIKMIIHHKSLIKILPKIDPDEIFSSNSIKFLIHRISTGYFFKILKDIF